MFSGLIEEIGHVNSIQKNNICATLSVFSPSIAQKASIGDSIAVNGVCLTVVLIESGVLFFDVMLETLIRSNLSYLTPKSLVNLEKSLTLTSFLGGHLVYGDVDCVSYIRSIKDEGNATRYWFTIDKQWLPYIVAKGRVAIDGASLTVISKDEQGFCVSLIPHSKSSLILGSQKIGDRVNIEVDIIAKYCNSLIETKQSQKEKDKHTLELLKENGFIT